MSVEFNPFGDREEFWWEWAPVDCTGEPLDTDVPDDVLIDIILGPALCDLFEIFSHQILKAMNGHVKQGAEFVELAEGPLDPDEEVSPPLGKEFHPEKYIHVSILN